MVDHDNNSYSVKKIISLKIKLIDNDPHEITENQTLIFLNEIKTYCKMIFFCNLHDYYDLFSDFQFKKMK
jgi:hypothetical protein